MALKHRPTAGATGPDELIAETGLADAGRPDDRDDLPVACASALQGLAQDFELCMPSHEAREATGGK
jgi:hypothetical protein